MTVKECYSAMNADYDDVIGRLRTDERVQRFLLRVLDDGSYALLVKSLDEKNTEEAFRAAHTLKGICMNLSLTPLYKSVDRLTEALRGKREIGDDVAPLFDNVRYDYEKISECIESLRQ